MYCVLKRCFDIIFSAVAFVVLLPLMGILILWIQLDSKGSGIYYHERIGKNHKGFKLYKLRTMYTEKIPLTEEQKREWEENYKLEDDPRITRIGRILRRASLDELPQFLNILKGDMSLIGPRPVIEEELKRYGEKQEELLKVLPGLTGYWQAYARNDVSYEERMRMELYYVEHMSFMFDIRIFFHTIGRLITQKGAK